MNQTGNPARTCGGASAERTHVLGRLLRGIARAPIADADERTFAGTCEGRRATNPAAGPRHEHRAAFETPCHEGHRERTIAALCPPKPYDAESTWRWETDRARFGT